jgi:hypothetical protein
MKLHVQHDEDWFEPIQPLSINIYHEHVNFVTSHVSSGDDSLTSAAHAHMLDTMQPCMLCDELLHKNHSFLISIMDNITT